MPILGRHFVCYSDIVNLMKYYFMLSFWSVCSLANGQSVKYYSNMGLQTSKDSCYYYTTYWQEDSDTLRSYYCSSNTLRSVEPRGEDGIALFYFENGKLRVKKNPADPPVGLVQTWYPDGKKHSVEYYEANSFSPLMVSYWDSTGIQQIANGNGSCRCIFSAWQQSDLLESGRLVKGRRDSIWVGTLKERHYFQETYREGTLLSGTSFDDRGNDYTYEEVEVFASPTDGMQGFYSFIGTTIKYPDQARRNNIQGTIYVEFTVEMDGSLSKVNVIKGIDKDCDREAVRVVSRSKKWTPRKLRGQPVQQKMVLPVALKLS